MDFFLCALDTIKPIAVVELDDGSHQRESVKERDQFKDAAFRAAGLRLVRIVARRAYNAATLLEALLPYLGNNSPGPARFATLASALLPTCPKCGIPMVLRTASKGEQRGSQFYGCSNYPKCREILPAGAERVFTPQAN